LYNSKTFPQYEKNNFFLLATCCLIQAFPQNINSTAENPAEYFNNFQKYSYSIPSADSAFFYFKKLAAHTEFSNMTTDLLHNSFAQSFKIQQIADTSELVSRRQHLVLCNQIFNLMLKDTSHNIAETVRPLGLWKSVQDNKDNLSELTRLSRFFLQTLKASNDIYSNRIGRYGLMIVQIISDKPGLKGISEEIFSYIYHQLENGQVKATDTASQLVLSKRAWFRYLYAYTNFIKAANSNAKELYFRKSFDFSPDALDVNNYAAFYYDMLFLFADEEKNTFRPDYLDYLIAHSSKKSRTMDFLLETALIQPEYKTKLEEYYVKNNTSSQSFKTYWMKAINARAKTAPLIQLPLLDGAIYSSKTGRGKWIVVDFWGTWCMPCRAEHPDLQKLYDSVLLKYPDNISLITIACRDNKEAVKKYLMEKNYIFPVAMSDLAIEKSFPLRGYPSKFLISPQGRFLRIPFGTNWVNFIKAYAGLP
jgi:thiol-disulfide isomerase/thioredoxin